MINVHEMRIDRAYILVDESEDEAAKCRQGQWENAIAKDANTLKERNRSSEELSIQSNCCSTKPNDHKDSSEDQRCGVPCNETSLG